MKTIFTCLLVGVVLFGFGQNTFKVRAFSTGGVYLNQVIQLTDRSYVAAGVLYNNTAKDSASLYLLKTDSSGNVLASKIVTNYIPGIPGPFTAQTITPSADGGFTVGGQFFHVEVIIKFRSDLTIQWKKQYLAPRGNIFIEKLIQTPDGGYLGTGGETDNYSAVAFVMKTDSVGNLLFAKHYMPYINYRFHTSSDIVATKDSNYAFVSFITGTTQIDSIRLTKIKPDGSILWTRYLPNSGNEIIPYALLATSDGGILIGGDIARPDISPTSRQLMMVKYKSNGTLLWAESAGILTNNNTCFAKTIAEDKGGNYIFGGQLNVIDALGNTDSSYIFAVKLNTRGDLIWTKTLAPSKSKNVSISSIMATKDGGFIGCGKNNQLGSVNTNTDTAFLLKFNADFETCVANTDQIGFLSFFGGSLTDSITAGDVPDLQVYNTNADITDGANTEKTCSSNVLPLQLLSFNATLQNKSVAVQWTTANEVNTSYFIVERSNNAASFSALQQVTSKGNSAGVQSYTTNDLQPLPGTSYYRLKEVDKDGKITYSSVVPVTMLNNGVVVISPNPVRDVIRVIMQSTANANVTCQVIDMKGTVLATQKTVVGEGRNEILIPAASLAKGVYVLKVIENNTMQTIRFVKE